MRIVLCLICLFICSNIFGQPDFENQLDLILRDSTNRFRSFKAGFKHQLADDSVFHSTFNLEGTVDNEVIISNEDYTYVMDHYKAIITTSISEKEGRKIADDWKNKLVAIVGKDFQVARLTSKKYPSQYGWSFERGFFWIGVVIIKGSKKDTSLQLYISYAHRREENINR